MPEPATYRQRAKELALGQYGYLTTADAEELGIPKNELVKMAGRGDFRHVAHGLYRFEDIPSTPYDQFYEAVARVGAGAHLTGDAVLAFHNLALVNPRRIRVGTPRRVERRLPPWLEMVRQRIPLEDLTVYELVPSTTVARAIRDCVPIVMGDRLHAAVDEAVSQGLVRERDVQGLRDAINAPRPRSKAATA